jgi:hypothetical protein
VLTREQVVLTCIAGEEAGGLSQAGQGGALATGRGGALA